MAGLGKWVAFAQGDTFGRVGPDLLRSLLVPLPGWLQPADLGTAEVPAIREEVRRLLTAAVSGERYRVGLRLVRQLWRDGRISNRPLSSTSSSHARDLVMHRVLGLLEQLGTDRLAICPEPKCGKLFVRITNKAYCSTRCQSRAWMRAERARNGQRERRRHVKKARARRR